MENIPVFSNRLEESNGIVENILEMKAKKTPWFLRFVPKAKGIVSFVQNLLSPLTRKEGVRGGQLSAFFQSAAAAIVGIGLLAGSTGDVQAACNPPVFDVCFHKLDRDWTRFGEAVMFVDFKVPSSKAGTTYRIEWWGYQRYVFGPFDIRYAWGKNQLPHTDTLSAGENQLSHTFLYHPDRNREDDPFIYDSYGMAIYEYNPNTRKDIKWVASVWFRPGQAAADVQVDSEYYSDLSLYYCTIDYDPNNYPGLKSGYDGPYWVRRTLWTAPWPIGRPYYVWGWTGNVGSPRFDYGHSCSHEVTLPQPWQPWLNH